MFLTVENNKQFKQFFNN